MSSIPPANETPVLAVEGISKTFHSGHDDIHVLSKVSLSVAPGETVSIRGSSGSGKTTLLNIMSGLESWDAGTVTWSGLQLDPKRLDQLGPRRGRHIGMVFQSFYLVPELNALENVLLAVRVAQGKLTRDDRSRAEQLLVEVGLQDRLKAIPATLSGGERQRVAVARALTNRPPVVLADEPTGNLDEHTADSVMDTLLQACANQQTALVLVTHNPTYAQRTQRSTSLHLGALE